jgi:hypothetical protein
MFFGGGQSSFIPGILSGARVGLFHKGGTVGRGGSSTTVHPGVFAGAPRYHSGGIAGLKPDEVPAILQKGEVVLPRGAKGGGGAQNINITVDVTGARGNTEIQEMVRQGVSQGIRQYDQGTKGRVVAAMRDARRRNVDF